MNPNDSVDVLTTYTDLELLDVLMQDAKLDNQPDHDVEGKPEYTSITVERAYLREALRRIG